MGDISTQVVVALAIGAVGLIFSMVSGVFHIFSTLKLGKYQGELQAQQRQQIRFENVEELMNVYKKPLVESANELQQRLSLLLLSSRRISDTQERQHSYMLHSTLYLVATFLGWLEVVREEIVFVTGQSAATLNEILDAIKFQFTGETTVQGFPRDHSVKSIEYNLDNPWHILQLYHVELRAIGEVMLSERVYDKKDKNTNLAVIGYAEFVRRFTMREPKLEEFTANGSDYVKFRAARDQWEASKEKLLQHNLRPLTLSVQKYIELSPEARPTERVAMLQVLLCKLIDFLDDGEPQPSSAYNEERLLPRNEWLDPLMDFLRRDALMWLWDRPFMEDCVKLVDPPIRKEWLSVVNSAEPWRNRHGEEVPLLVFRRLAFPGFRGDMRWSHPGAGMSSTYLSGAFPPKIRPAALLQEPIYYLQVNAPLLWARLTFGAVQDGGPLRDPWRRRRTSAGGGGSGTLHALSPPLMMSQRSSAVPPLSPPPPAHPRPLYLAPIVPTITATSGRAAEEAAAQAGTVGTASGGGGGGGAAVRPLPQQAVQSMRI